MHTTETEEVETGNLTAGVLQIEEAVNPRLGTENIDLIVRENCAIESGILEIMIDEVSTEMSTETETGVLIFLLSVANRVFKLIFLLLLL